MEQLGRSVLSVVTAAVIVGILASLTHEKNGVGVLIRMICGLFLALHLISPFTQLDFDVIASFTENFSAEGDLVAAGGTEMASEARRTIIIEQTQAYILDKAEHLGAALEVEVNLTQEEIPVIDSVRLQGSISPYAKIKMQQMMEADLDVPKERQIWIE